MLTNENNFIASTKFIVFFVVAFVLQYVLYFSIPDQFLLNNVYHDFIVMPVLHIINFVFPAESAYALSNSIRSAKVDLEVLRGCDGSGMLFLLEAAMIVFPSSIERKVLGLLAAFLLIYFLNSIRLFLLFYLASFRPEMFEVFHSLYIPMLLILLSGMFFFAWSIDARSMKRSNGPT